MRTEARRCAESVYRVLQEDLRFADAKAIFVGLVVVPFCGFINFAVGLGEASNALPVKILGTVFLGLAALALLFAFLAALPRFPRLRPESVHQLRALRRLQPRRGEAEDMAVERLAAKFEDQPGQPGSGYDSSLLLDICRVAARCHLKYQFVRAAVALALLAFSCGTATLLLRMWGV